MCVWFTWMENMNILGQYNTSTIEEIEAGKVFTSARSSGKSLVSYIGLKGFFTDQGQNKPCAIIFNGSAYQDDKKDGEIGVIKPYFYNLSAFPGNRVLDITSEIFHILS